MAPIDGIRFVHARAAGWIVSKVDADTGAAYLGELSAVMPAPVFDGTKASVRETVGPQRWAELVQRMPALAWQRRRPLRV